ncbi:hypothetical protein HYS31_03610 [Candidatus Woesearchaeota archaeon]|nr:hypothetical protein [Candidatus Woesearchaeota archaeon]
MKIRYVLLGFIILALVLNACQQKTTCNKPYILVGNSCCLDSNNNNICDTDEVKKTKTEEISCSSPYIKVGNNCCLDKNDNKVCDSDEKQLEAKPEVKEEKVISINDLQSDINKVLDTPILLVKDSNTDKFQVYSDIITKSKFLGKYGATTYFKIITKKPVTVIQITDKNSYLKDYDDFYDFVRNNKNIFVESALKSKEIFENEFKNGELPKLIYLQAKPRDTSSPEKAWYNGSKEVSSKVFFDDITFPETVSKRIAQIFYVRVNKYEVNISALYAGIITRDLSNINLAYSMIVYCNPSLVISLNEECFGQGVYFCQGTGVSHDTDFDRYDVDANFFLTNLRSYHDPYTRWTQALIDMCDQKYQFTYLKSTVT